MVASKLRQRGHFRCLLRVAITVLLLLHHLQREGNLNLTAAEVDLLYATSTNEIAQVLKQTLVPSSLDPAARVTRKKATHSHLLLLLLPLLKFLCHRARMDYHDSTVKITVSTDQDINIAVTKRNEIEDIANETLRKNAKSTVIDATEIETIMTFPIGRKVTIVEAVYHDANETLSEIETIIENPTRLATDDTGEIYQLMFPAFFFFSWNSSIFSILICSLYL